MKKTCDNRKKFTGFALKFREEYQSIMKDKRRPDARESV